MSFDLLWFYLQFLNCVRPCVPEGHQWLISSSFLYLLTKIFIREIRVNPVFAGVYDWQAVAIFASIKKALNLWIQGL